MINANLIYMLNVFDSDLHYFMVIFINNKIQLIENYHLKFRHY